MKRKINKIYILFFTLLFSVLFIGFSGNPPNGNTGAPGDSLCTGCHSNSNPNGFAGTVDVLNFPSTITPNTTYNLTAEIVYTSGTPVRAGFQAVILDASNNNSGDLSTTDPNVASTTAGSREYVEHDPSQSFGTGTSVTYNFDWVAPNAPNGEVITLYIASLFGNGANGNGGDLTITNSISGTIDAGSSPPSSSTTSTDVSCFGGNDGTATAQGSGGTPGYTYAWSNGGSGATISSLIAGTYTVTVTDAASLTATTTAIVGEPTQLSLLVVNQTNVDCFGNSTGSASVNGSGGTAGYSYNWSNGGSGATNSNLPAGTYTATVTDGNSCTSTEVVTITQPSAISLLASSTNVTCNGDNNGTASAFGNGGGGGFSYAWSNGMFGQSISNLTPGTYTVTATDGNNCTQTESTSVTQPTPIILTTTSSNINCNGENNGTASAFGSGGASGFSYAWSNGLNGQTISNLTAGTYTVTATDINNCFEVQTVNLIEPSAITVNILPTNISCNGANDASATAMGNGGTGSFTYTWSNGMSGQTISNLSAGTYTATATDVNNCTQTQTVSFNEPNAISVTISPTNVLCNGDNNGSATANGNGGTGGFTYSWSNGMSGVTISNLAPGSYTVTAADVNNCTQMESVTISESSPITLNVFSNEISCNNANDGSATASGNGGAGNFTYLWSNGMSGATTSNLSAGTYTVSASDANNCVQTEVVTITNPSAISLTLTQNNIDCFGNSNGSATASGIGGTGNLAYTWSNGMSGTTISNLTAGTYTASATDVNNCVQTQTVTITEPIGINISTTQTNINCFGNSNGSASANGSGGTGNLTYTWSNGMSGENISNLTAGTYTLTVTDSNNCTVTESVTINQPSNLIVNASATGETAAGANDGTATAAPSGGNSNYSFAWSTGSSNQTISNLSPGNYTVTITDNNMCTAEETVIVSSFNCAVSIDATIIDALCFGGFGSATAIAQNGTAPVSYLWSTGETVPTISGLIPNAIYSVTVTDANNCPASMSISISQPPQLQITASTSEVSCNGLSDGSVIITVTGGTAPYSYTLPNGDGNNLPAGLYTASVLDVNNCSINIDFEITEPSVISPNATATAVTANGANDGSAASNPSGGIGNFTFVWSNGMTTPMINNLTPGSYTVTISDVNNCSSSQTVIVNDIGCAIAISTTATNLLCFGDNNGMANVSVNIGAAPFTYLWSNGETTETISNLVAGSYTVTVTDNDNCPVSETVTISQPDLLELSESVQSVLQLDCFENNNGVAAIEATGGAGGNTFNWSNGMTGNPISNLPAGTFTGTVTDANGCFETINFTITQPDELITSITSTDETAANSNDGTATASPTGGIGTFNFLWSNGAMTASISNLAPGTYTVTTTDANNCESIEFVEVNAFGCSLTATISTTNATCSDATDGAATVTPSGGQNFTYAWSSGGNLATEINLLPGTYTVTINDASNCTLIETVTIQVVDNILPTAISQNISVDLDASGNATITPFMIDDGSIDNCGGVTLDINITSFDCDDLGENTITLTVSDLAGNQDTTTAIVTVNDLLPPTISCPTNIVIDECTGLVTYGNPIFSDNCAAPSFTFMGPASGTVFPIGETIITMTAFDQSDNSTSCTFTVNIDHVLELSTTSTNSPCAGDNLGTANANATGTSTTFDYIWSNGAVTSNILNLSPDTYTVTVTDDLGCTSTEEVIINEALPIEIIIDNIIAESDVNAADGAIEISTNGGVGPLNYNWTLNGNTVSTNEDPTGLTGGIYILIITDQNGCTIISAEITVDVMVDNENLILEKNIHLFPNPANDQLFLDFDLAINFDFHITIHDAIGNVLLGKNATNISNQKLELEVSNLVSGLYFVKIQTGDHVWVRKFILQK